MRASIADRRVLQTPTHQAGFLASTRSADRRTATTSGSAAAFSVPRRLLTHGHRYLIKQHQLLQGASPQYSRMYKDSIISAYQHLIRPINVVPGMEGMVTIGDLHFRELHEGELKSWYSMRLDHLTSFAGGMLGLGAKLLDRPMDLVTAVNFTRACLWAYDATRSGLAPEIMQFWVESDSRRWDTVKMAGESGLHRATDVD